ncbi:hypothetical protein N0V90_006627 [Kalmusia sp. IMI 367209]|nr:hypothetical protein N0V90_006627 [Kalmusia sp. IMI 367209]
MATDPSEARLNFLRQAAYQLATSAPAVSATISSAYTYSAIETENDLQRARKKWDTLRREICGACGSILLVGWSSSMAHQSHTASAKKGRAEMPKTSKKQIVHTCLRCDRKSVQFLQSRAPKHVNSKVQHDIAEAADLGLPDRQAKEDQNKIMKSANATSKQRRKSRKGGLQAMLEKNKTQISGQGGLGLDLMDFMQ